MFPLRHHISKYLSGFSNFRAWARSTCNKLLANSWRCNQTHQHNEQVKRVNFYAARREEIPFPWATTQGAKEQREDNGCRSCRGDDTTGEPGMDETARAPARKNPREKISWLRSFFHRGGNVSKAGEKIRSSRAELISRFMTARVKTIRWGPATRSPLNMNDAEYPGVDGNI